MEYLFAVRDADGGERTVVDPTNPARVAGASGDHSVRELPGYSPPRWLQVSPVPSTCSPLPVIGTAVGDVDVTVRAPAHAEPAETLPLIVAHDGPELSSYAALDRFVAAGIATGELPRMRLALLGPGERDVCYSANADYARALVAEVLPTVRAAQPATADMVGLGASLGDLAMLRLGLKIPRMVLVQETGRQTCAGPT
ncbi:MAG: alpha/beta hydrolase-fold protein, partial [Actinomycetota bacterium]|nr:alpha/beta hydrolase-fold protein [Actinomycetota bacterium]